MPPAEEKGEDRSVFVFFFLDAAYQGARSDVISWGEQSHQSERPEHSLDQAKKYIYIHTNLDLFFFFKQSWVKQQEQHCSQTVTAD